MLSPCFECHFECHPECYPENDPECQDQWDMVRNHIVMFLSREGQSKPVRKLVITSETVTETNLSTYVSPAIMTNPHPKVRSQKLVRMV